MGAQAKIFADAGADLEHDLVENIARAMKSRPLMRRLANVEVPPIGDLPPLEIEAEPPPPEHLPDPERVAETPAPEPTPTAEDPLAIFRQRLEEAEDSWTMPPSSAEWLGKAQRERARARLRNAAAWLATLIIGGSIITATALMLQP